MRPLLASLALLLLALSRPSSSEDGTSISSFKELAADAQKEQLNKNFEVMGVFVAVDTLIDNSELVYEDQANNNVLCALADATFADTLKKLMYGDQLLTPKQKKQEEDAAKDKPVGVDCATTEDAKKALDEWKCFCTDKKVVAFCALHKYKREKAPTATVGKCKKAALDDLKTKGTKELGDHYDFSVMPKDYDDFEANLPKLFDENVIDVISKNGDVKVLNFFCDAVDNTVAPALETLFKSDYVYPTMDAGFLRVLLYYTTYGEMPQARNEQTRELVHAAFTQFEEECKKPDFVADSFHACICKPDKGVLYCIYNAIGTELKTSGYLKCTPGTPPVVDKEKKPAKVAPQFLKPKPKPSPVPDVPAASNDTTTAAAPPSGSAASSSLLLVPLAAAAAMLLRP